MSKRGNLSNISAIVEQHMKLAEKMAHRRAIPGYCEFDDLKQICSMSLMKVASTFNPEKGATFATYACRVMQNDINNYLDKQRGTFEHEVHVEDETFAHETSEIESRVESSVLVGQLKDILAEDEYRVLIMVHAQGLSQSEVAKVIGCGQPQVCRILKRAINKSRAALDGGYKCAV
jgi:RNA polymerase sigma factor (sigma-70 family)